MATLGLHSHVGAVSAEQWTLTSRARVAQSPGPYLPTLLTVLPGCLLWALTLQVLVNKQILKTSGQPLVAL